MLSRDRIEKMIRKSRSLLEGHFELTSGLHSDKYLQCALLLQDPMRSEILCRELADRFKDSEIDVVVGPAMGGIIVSYETARCLGCRSVFTERKDEKMVLRRGFALARNERVLIVEDVVTTGGSVKEVISLVREKGAIVVGVGAIVDRLPREMNFGSLQFKPLIRLDIKTFEREECPLCKKGIKLIKPGSRKDNQKEKD